MSGPHWQRQARPGIAGAGFVHRWQKDYTISPIGSVIGLGLVDGLVGGAVIAWLYNVIAGNAAISAFL